MLPTIALPFVKLAGADSHAAFELLACLLSNWAAGWWEHFPDPPVTLLRKLLVRRNAVVHGMAALADGWPVAGLCPHMARKHVACKAMKGRVD